MTTEREELALRFLCQGFPYYDPAAESMDDPRISPEHKASAYESVSIVENAGWSKPRKITTAEERDALPAGIVVRSARGTVAARHESGVGVLFGDERPFDWRYLEIPLTVLDPVSE